MTIRPLEQSLPIQLLEAHDLVMRYFRPMLLRFRMTDQQWRVLRVIAADGEVDFRVLSGRCLIQPASLSRMLDTMETDGRIIRRVNPRDARQRLVSLAPAGQAVFTQASVETEAIHRRLEADLGDSYGPVIAAIAGMRAQLDQTPRDS